MFQSQFAEKSEYNHGGEIFQVPNFKWKKEDIEYKRVMFWEEHCLECAPPDCYNTCIYFKERVDGLCRNSFFGLCPFNQINEFPDSFELTYRKWGKIESKCYAKTLVNKKNSIRQKRFNQFSSVINMFSKITNLCHIKYLPSLHISSFYRKKLIKETQKADKDSPTEFFLFQCFSYHKCNLIFELSEKKETLFKYKIQLHEGYNEICISIPELYHFGNKDRLAILFPEDNAELHLIIFECSFVHFKTGLINSMIIPEKPDKKVKCLVWDLDNTLWNGILMESNPNSLSLRSGVLELIKELDKRGIIQSIASKNNYEEAKSVLERLGVFEYFVCPMIHFGQKSNSVYQIAKILNIGIDSLAIIDDSPFERAEVHQKYSCVRVYDENMISHLSSLSEMQTVITVESKQRRKMYQDELKRKNIQYTSTDNITDFLKECQITLEIRPPKNSQELERCFELLVRTNQLNLSKKTYQFEDFMKSYGDLSNPSILLGICKDKFGSYGQILVMHIENDRDVLTVNEFAMSCRVANKCLESAVLSYLFNCQKGKGTIQLIGYKTFKNTLLINSFVSAGMLDFSQDDKLVLEIKSPHDIKNQGVVTLV